uniref:TFIIS N-terminal domain-containing protein n=1 Tax=Otus sunia TaxID=257818 RepID=A0A8C8AVS1_9STRI
RWDDLEGALDLLKSLTGYTMTIQLLQTTRIGVAVNSVRKHCSDEEVVTSAKILIKNWKRLYLVYPSLPVHGYWQHCWGTEGQLPAARAAFREGRNGIFFPFPSLGLFIPWGRAVWTVLVRPCPILSLCP